MATVQTHDAVARGLIACASDAQLLAMTFLVDVQKINKLHAPYRSTVTVALLKQVARNSHSQCEA